MTFSVYRISHSWGGTGASERLCKDPALSGLRTLGPVNPRTAAVVLLVFATSAAACSHGGSAGTAATATAAPSTTTAPTSIDQESAVTTQARSSEAPADCVGELDGPAAHRYRTDVGDEEPDLVSVDVYRRPSATDCPVLIWIHGGGWTVGDKAGRAIETKVDFAGELGAVLVSVNHRLVTPGSQIRWPTMGQDAAAAVAWVADNADELGVDPERIALMGHSAGAHLVASLGTNPDLLGGFAMSRDDLRCVVTLDSAAYEVSEGDVRSKGLFESAFGTDPVVLADASPTVQAVEHAGDMPEFIIVTRGTETRTAEAEAFAEALEAAGSSAELVDAGGYSHEEVNTAVGDDGEDVVTPPVRRFLESCLR